MISGAVTFTLTAPRRFECIKVDFLGKAHARWTMVSVYRDEYHQVTRAPVCFVGDQAYVQQSLLLWTPQQSKDGTIGPGSFSFQFRFVVPFHVPSSFLYENMPASSSSASISYEVEGRAVTGRSYVDYEDSIKVYITNPANRISDASWITPVSLVKRKQVGFLCCAAGDIEFVAKLPRTGYDVTNDDVLSLAVDVQNNSTRVIEMKAEILQRVTMFAQDEFQTRLFRENRCCKTLAEAYSQPIQPGNSYKWNAINWTIPRLPPTLLGCRVVCVEYVLLVSAIIPNARNMICNIPLFMGKLPYARTSLTSEGTNHALHSGAMVPVVAQGYRPSAGICNDYNNIDEENRSVDLYNSSERNTLI